MVRIACGEFAKIKSGARAEDRRLAEAGLNQADANLANAKSNHARTTELFENGAISQQSLEGTKTQLDIAIAQHKIVREQLQLIDNGARVEDIQAMEAQVEQAESSLRLVETQAETKTWEKDIELSRSQVEMARAGLIAAEALADAICKAVRLKFLADSWKEKPLLPQVSIL